MSADHFDRAAALLREAAREIEQAGSQRIVIRVLHTGDGWQPLPEPVHACTSACTQDGVSGGVCEITEAELRAAHRKAEEQVEWLRRWWPLDGTDD